MRRNLSTLPADPAQLPSDPRSGGRNGAAGTSECLQGSLRGSVPVGICEIKAVTPQWDRMWACRRDPCSSVWEVIFLLSKKKRLWDRAFPALMGFDYVGCWEGARYSSVGFDECPVSFTHCPCGLGNTGSAARKVPWPSLHLSSRSLNPGTLIHLLSLYFCPFPEHDMNGIIQCVAFSD